MTTEAEAIAKLAHGAALAQIVRTADGREILVHSDDVSEQDVSDPHASS